MFNFFKIGLSFVLLFQLALVNAANHHPQEFLNSISGRKDEGKQIVEHFCANCHAEKPVIPVGAPRIGNISDWDNRVAAGLDELFKHTDEGLNAMPARGGCFECTDKQLILSILYMLPDQARSSFHKELKAHQKTKQNK